MHQHWPMSCGCSKEVVFVSFQINTNKYILRIDGIIASRRSSRRTSYASVWGGIGERKPDRICTHARLKFVRESTTENNILPFLSLNLSNTPQSFLLLIQMYIDSTRVYVRLTIYNTFYITTNKKHPVSHTFFFSFLNRSTRASTGTLFLCAL